MSYKYEDRFVAFIDILGFSNIIKNTINSDKILNQLGSAITFIRNYFNEIKADIDDPADLQITQFSDSIVISVSMKNSLEMTVIFKHLKNVQLNLIDRNILLRGGIVKGKLIHSEDLLFGPGIIKAHDLESRCALHPRIVIDPKVLWQVGKINGEKQNLKLKDFHWEKSFAKEMDGTYYIDYFNDVENYIDNSAEGYFKNLCTIIAEHIDSEDMSVRVKYLWLREKLKLGEYFKSFKHLYKEIVTDRHKKE